jgi:hypothetical protein
VKDGSQAVKERIGQALRQDGYLFVPGADARAFAESHGSLADWDAFAASWNDLHLDQYMADGGRYRRRRYAVYSVAADGTATREAHQPHYQKLDYNPLHGGVERWFEPLTEAIGAGATLQTLLKMCARSFGEQAPTVRNWHAEVHQFRIEARHDMPGQPTPEGPHRDGVDYVLVLLVARHNIERGTTVVYDLQRRELGSFTLTYPFDATFVDDARVYHGVTPVQPLDPAQASSRDVLVVTFRAQ